MSLASIYWRGADAELSHRVHIQKPDAIGSIKDVEYYNAKAAQAIAEAESLIETLKEYQQALYARYQEIYHTNFKLFLKLERNVSYYSNKKTYVITVSKRYDGNNVADVEIIRETYPGTERHKALKRYEALQKEYPNIEHEADIAKKHWER